MTVPLATQAPDVTRTSDRYESDTLKPDTGSIVTVLIPATEPAKVTRPDTGARTVSPASAA